MKSRISLPVSFLFIVTSLTVNAGSPAKEPSENAFVTSDPGPSRWRLGVGYAPLIGLKTQFSGLGNFSPAFPTQPLGGGVDYNYDDGFVRVDSSGNLGGETWNWGYENASQIDPSGFGSVDYTLTRGLANGKTEEDGGGEVGFEMFGYLDMGAASLIPMIEKRGATWGFRSGFHYNHVDVDDRSTISSNTVTQTDRFNLNGTITPPSPYRSGSFNGPGPLIGDAPSRSFGPGGSAFITGSRELDVHLNIFSLGSYLELPVLTNLSFMFEGGVSAGIASGSYDFQSQTSISRLGTRTSSGSDSQTSVLPGFYLGIEAIYQVNKNWGIQAGGRYQFMDELELESNGSSAALSFDSAFVISLGAVYSF
jgi:hypothetical protein